MTTKLTSWSINPNSFNLSKREALSASGPVEYLPLYLSTTFTGACNGPG